MKLKIISEIRLENTGKCKLCKFSSHWLEYGNWNWESNYRTDLDNLKDKAIKVFDNILRNNNIIKFDDGTFVRLAPNLSE